MQDVDTSPLRGRNRLQERPVVYCKTAPHQDSYQISNILNPVRGVRDKMRREGKQPRNHAKDNLMAIRNQSLQNRLQKEIGKKLPEQKRKSNNVRSSNYGKVTRQTTSNVSRPASSKDFISQNKSALHGMKSKKSDKAPEQLFKEKENYGKLPRYLLERKIQLAEEYERRREGEKHARAPPGTRLMAEDERLLTLEMLESNKAEVEKHLKLLPFVVETPSQIKAKTDLENRLKEIEDAQRMFSRPVVYVKI
ncbi:enkurin domain-containing protein [Chloropicon primus]|uniref:Enkurin domain-containing protein n=1 Tax=Chloropicon primus TaxID=1764295 RepID=A0A5B8MGX4_9CHLO|nr:enkurin domain-containing protein [Chloropicon primus]|eukprot:QDZ19673.1 enkurin domain-containing protein [Chloropicon primus]